MGSPVEDISPSGVYREDLTPFLWCWFPIAHGQKKTSSVVVAGVVSVVQCRQTVPRALVVIVVKVSVTVLLETPPLPLLTGTLALR